MTSSEAEGSGDIGRGTPDADITHLLAASKRGDVAARDALMPLIYRELHALAHRRMLAASPGSTLQTTALVHEAYLKLLGKDADFEDRAHFFAYAGSVMRSIIVDAARRRISEKRGGKMRRVTLHSDAGVTTASPEQILQLDDIMSNLDSTDPRLLRLVEMRVFSGLSIREASSVSGLSERTLKRDWRRARALIAHLLAQELQPVN